MSDNNNNNNNTNGSQGQPDPAPASDTPNMVNILPGVVAAAAAAAAVAAATAAASAFSGIYSIIERLDSLENALQEEMDEVHQDIALVLQRVDTPFDRLGANVQENLRNALRRASVVPGVRRFAPELGITEGLRPDDWVMAPEWAQEFRAARRRDRELARQWRRRNQSDQDRLIEEEHAEDIAELNEMYLGQQVQITHAGRSQLRQLGFRVRSDGMVWVRRLDEDE